MVVVKYCRHLTLDFIFQGELKHSLDISQPKFVFVSEECSNVLPVLKKLRYVKLIILLDNNGAEEGKIIPYKTLISKYGSTSFDVEKYASQPVKRSEQVALIFMSSGTTGLPKGQVLNRI
jgi:long-subunit acyl-CoA synthetase (AMP-forming)